MDGCSAGMNAVTQLRTIRGWRGGAAVALALALSLPAAEWSSYRGPTHNGVTTERLNKQWTGAVTNPVWRVALTNGITSLTVKAGRVFTQAAEDSDGDGYGDRELCIALNATNGAMLWATEVDAQSFLYPNGGVGYTDDGPRSTPVLYGDSVYVLSSYLKLHRLNAANGAVIWSTNLVAGFGGSVIAWQNAASPVIENGLVFVNANAPANSLMAFNATNGALVWRSQNESMTHASPVLATIQGVRHLIFATQSGLVSLNPTNGALWWKFPYPFGYSTSIGASPAVYQDYLFISAAYGMGGVGVQVALSNSTWTATQRWRNASLASHWATPVCYQGAIFGQFTPDDASAQLRCIDVATGAQRWATNGFGRGAVLLAGANLLVITERGDLVLAAANTNSYQELGRFQAIANFNTDQNKCWNALAVSDGQVYVRSTAYAARFDLSQPDLKLDPPVALAGNQLRLDIRTVTGAPLTSNRLATLEVRASTNAALAPAFWSKLTNSIILTNGIARLTNVDAAPRQRFFRTVEPP